jgi:polysulfide reductase chain C
MPMERQSTYGWHVALDLFLGGVGAGAFLVGFAFSIFKTQEFVAGIVFISGPFLVLMGAFFLLMDITMRRRFYRIYSNFNSWTSRGAWIITFFMVSGLTYATLYSQYFSNFNRMNAPIFAAVIGAVAALFSLLVLIYPGLLMGAIQAVPFWNTPILPLLFLISGLSNGTAFLILLIPLFQTTFAGIVEILHIFGGTIILTIFFQAAVIYTFLEKTARGNNASRESLRLFKESQFKLKFIVPGIIAPLCLLLFGLFINEVFLLSMVSISAAVLSLTGGLYLRYAIVRAGVFLPRFSI